MDIRPQVHLSSAELREQFDRSGRLEEFCLLLADENKRVNLVSRETSPAQMLALAIESLVPLAFLEGSKITSYLDIGSGGGFPAFPLILSGKLTLKRPSVLVERTGKKAAALQRIASGLGQSIDPVPNDLASAKITAKFDLVTIRYVKLTSKLLTDAVKLLSPSGCLAYYSQPEFDPKPFLVRAEVIPYIIDNQEPERRLTLLRLTQR
jgi:16S rRNA G527 N7-methylase RsmG